MRAIRLVSPWLTLGCLLGCLPQSRATAGAVLVVINYTGAVKTSNDPTNLPVGSAITGQLSYVVGSIYTPKGSVLNGVTTYNYTGSSAGHAFNFSYFGSDFTYSDSSVTGSTGSFIIALSPGSTPTQFRLTGNTKVNPGNNRAFDLTIPGLTLSSNGLPLSFGSTTAVGTLVYTGTPALDSPFGAGADFPSNPSFNADITVEPGGVSNIDLPAEVPEPTTWLAATVGLLAAGWPRARRWIGSRGRTVA